MAVRTKLLASGRRTDSSLATVYTVPEGETCIVKRIVIVNLSTTTSATYLIAMDAGAFDNTLWREEGLAARKSADIDTWQVLPPGSTIAIQGPGTPAINFWISGTELEGVAD